MSKAWPQVSIGSVAKPIERLESPQSGKTYRQIGVRLWGQGAYERNSIDGSETKYKTLNRVKDGDIIVNKIWARNGSVSVVSSELEGCYCSGEFPIFEPILTQLEPKWFYWITKTHWFWERCNAQSRGTSGKNRIRPEKFMAISIPLPPLAEQQRIVAKIERLAGKIVYARSLQDKSMLGSDYFLFSSIGDTFKKMESAEKIVSFNELYPHITSGPRNWSQYYKSEGYRFYRAQDIGLKGEILDKDKKFLEPPPGNQGRNAQLQIGDLMIVITGATVGRVTIFTEDREPGFVSQHVSICRLPKDIINPKYALWGLRGPKGQEQLICQRYGQGKPGLNLTNISNLKLPLPSLAEQHKIVKKLDKLQDKLDVIKSLQAQTAAGLDAMLPSILDKAFKGEL